MEDAMAIDHLLLDAVFMETVGMRPVIVHGGGAAISAAMSNAGIEPRFVQGRRYTDEPSLEIVKQVLGKEISNSLVSKVETLGGQAKALSASMGTGVLHGKKLVLNDEKGNPIDMGLVGEVTHVDARIILDLCNDGIIPIIPSIALCDEHPGMVLNVNADTAATAVAKALQAEKLVFVSEVNGLRTNPTDPNSMIDSINAEKAKEMLASGVIIGGMIPKIQACLETLERGVNKIHIINGRLLHSLLLEIFTSMGVGTEITQE